MALLLVSVVLALSLFLIYAVAKPRHVGHQTLKDYRRLFPHCVYEYVVRCYICDSVDIAVRATGQLLESNSQSHVCRGCGAELFRA